MRAIGALMIFVPLFCFQLFAIYNSSKDIKETVITELVAMAVTAYIVLAVWLMER